MDIKIKIILIVVALMAISYGVGRYLQPVKEVIKTETVIKTVTVNHVDTVTVVKEITKPDGTKEKTTTTTDKSKIDTNTDSDTKTSIVITNQKPQWKVSALLTTKQGSFGPVYGAMVERRILGPIFAGAFANTDKAVGLTVGLEF